MDMDMYAVTQDEAKLDAVSYPENETQRISGHVAEFIRRLVQVCEDPKVKERWNTTMSVDDAGVAVMISSPFGSASGELNFVISDNKIEGQWIIRKHSADQDGAKVRVKVASLRVTKDGLIFLGVTQPHGINAKNRYGGEDREAYLTMSALLYALGSVEAG